MACGSHPCLQHGWSTAPDCSPEASLIQHARLQLEQSSRFKAKPIPFLPRPRTKWPSVLALPTMPMRET